MTTPTTNLKKAAERAAKALPEGLTKKQQSAMIAIKCGNGLTALELATALGYKAAAPARSMARGLVRKGLAEEDGGLFFSSPRPKKKRATKPNGRVVSGIDKPAAHVGRWMGVEGWTIEEAANVLESLGVDMGRPSIRNLLSEGRNREARAARGLTEPVAKLTRAEAAALRRLRKSFAESATLNEAREDAKKAVESELIAIASGDVVDSIATQLTKSIVKTAGYESRRAAAGRGSKQQGRG